MRCGSWIITDEDCDGGEWFAPVTPGEMPKEEFLAEYELSQNQLAKAVGISPLRITEIVNNRRRITADTALRFGSYFGNSSEFWLNLQTPYDLKLARRKLKRQLAMRIKAQRAQGVPPNVTHHAGSPRTSPCRLPADQTFNVEQIR